MAPPHTRIEVGQRLLNWDGSRGYVATNSAGRHAFGPGEPFLVEWLGLDGTIEDADYVCLEDFPERGIRWGRGRMAWAR